MKFEHRPVLLQECIEGLQIKQNGIYVDGTMGGAGHSIEIVKRLSNEGILIGIDRDEEALKASKERLAEYKNVTYVHDNHDNIKQILQKLEINQVDGILLDLGVSSYQLDERNRGFSYLGENELDMRMDKSQELTAKRVVNYYSEKDVCVPILGAGTTSIDGGAGASISQQDLLDMMIWSYKLSSHKIKAPHKLRIICKKNSGFSINNIGG